MKKTIFILLLSLNVSAQYREDILKNGYEVRDIVLNDDYEGRVKASLIRKLTTKKSKGAILYIHGYNDYFFQKHLGNRLTDEGYNFYALDLRKYGRSFLPNQRLCYFKNIKEYYPELDSSINIIEKEGNKKIIFNAHSTGGLIIANYLNDRKNDKRICSAIFNSPFFEFNVNWFLKILLPFISSKGKNKPYDVFTKSDDDNYFKSLYYKERGEWNFNINWKKKLATPITYGWIRGIYSAQKRIQKNSNINIPLVVFHSDRSYNDKKWSENIMNSDYVLNVKDIQKYGKKLGNNIILQNIPNGMHDLVLSSKSVREFYLDKLIYWCNRFIKSKNN